jgi:hypothetical protein
MASIGSSVFARGLGQAGGIATSGDSRLPDGTPYAAWEQPLTFSKTYYVDNGDAGADDEHTSRSRYVGFACCVGCGGSPRAVLAAVEWCGLRAFRPKWRISWIRSRCQTPLLDTAAPRLR